MAAEGAGGNSAASFVAGATSPQTVNPIEFPGFGPKKEKSFDPKNFSVRYKRIDFDIDDSVSELEDIETAGLLGEDIVVLYKEKFTFMDKFIMIICFLERKAT